MTVFTADATEAGEARIRADLDHILAAIRNEAEGDGLLAVFLLGGYAKSEGTVVTAPDGTPRGFNDYDLLLVFSSLPERPQRYAELAVRLAREVEIDFVDLGLATPRDLAQAPPTLFWYEFGEAHVELWSGSGVEATPARFSPADVNRDEGSLLLLNRGMALLWAALRLWPETGPGGDRLTTDSAHLQFSVIAAHKAVAAAGDAALLRAGLYSPHQAERLKVLAARPELVDWAPAGFREAYEDAAAFRRRPRPVAAEEAAVLWERARRHHEAGFRAAERARLGGDIHRWPDHERLLKSAGRRRLVQPREAARAVRRSLREGNWLAAEERFLLALPPLLYGAPGDDVLRWREESEAVVRRWHP